MQISSVFLVNYRIQITLVKVSQHFIEREGNRDERGNFTLKFLEIQIETEKPPNSEIVTDFIMKLK